MKRELNKFQLYTLYCSRLTGVIALISVIGCGAAHHLTNEDIMWIDDDQYHVPEPPKEREPNSTWDYVHRSFIHPADRFFNFPRYLSSNEAVNVNALGEVPNSSWYTNRHAHERMSMEELLRGPNQGSSPNTSGTSPKGLPDFLWASRTSVEQRLAG